MATSSGKEIQAIVNCLLCDTYFMIVVFHLDPLKFRRRTGKDALTDELVDVSQRLFKNLCSLHPCPTCIELSVNQTFKIWLNTTMDAVLTPCCYVCFDCDEDGGSSGVPLYCSSSDGKGCKLIQGVGPQGLSPDGTTSHRLYKKQLVPFINNTMKNNDINHNKRIPAAPFSKQYDSTESNLSMDQHVYVIDTVLKFWGYQQDDTAIVDLFRFRPLFSLWYNENNSLSGDLEAFILECEYNEINHINPKNDKNKNKK